MSRIRITARPLAAIVLNPFGAQARGISLQGERLTIEARRRRDVHLGSLRAAPAVNKGFWGSVIRVLDDDGDVSVLRGVRHNEAEAFAKTVRENWISYTAARLKEWRPVFDELLREVAELSESVDYPSASFLSPILERARTLDRELLSKLALDAVGEETFSKAQMIRDFVSQARGLRDQAVKRFETRELSLWAEFFDGFENHPLTEEQRIAVIADEDATLVLAGAGSGKTSVITAKAAYLLKSARRRTDEILLLAFAANAAREMSERITEKTSEALETRTFHSLAYHIIGAVEGSKPALAAHATDDKAFFALIKDILKGLAKMNNPASSLIIRWFSHARLVDKSEWDFAKKHDYYTHIEKLDLRTLQGERVKSYEELMIANWLFVNGIKYQYEPDYERQVSSGGKRNYCPDFRLIKSGVYLEHFGVRRVRAGDPNSPFTTAPQVDRDDYLKNMKWKRDVHAEHGTTLIETFSYERQEGRLLEALAEKIAPYETIAPRSPETVFDRVLELKQADGLVKLIGTFLRLYKGGGYQLEDCAAKGARSGARAAAFLSIFKQVYAEYQRRLNGRIDFEDMILRAADYAERGKYRSPFKHILVDEFQDISNGRAQLIKALKAQQADAKVFAVGDDWQSIYRFAGSNIDIMRNFGEEFGGEFDGQRAVHRKVDLGRTFRSVDQIAHAAKKFVLRNPLQIRKTMAPAGSATRPALKVVLTFLSDVDRRLEEVLRELPSHREGAEGVSVLLLGRYKHDAPDRLPRLRRAFPHLDIRFRTIHAAKGLEADHVVILGLHRGRFGFPSEIDDDPLLDLVSPDAEPFEHAEERRVMYVALTRARHTVTLMCSAFRQSAFVTELLDDPEYGVVGDAKKQQAGHICGQCGGKLLALPTKSGRTRFCCEHTELCGFSLRSCERCGTGLPVKQKGKGVMICDCGAEYPECSRCENGWFVERHGRFGRFLGCVSYPSCTGKAKAGSPART